MSQAKATDHESTLNTSPTRWRVSLFRRLCVAAQLIATLRKPDFQAAGSYVGARYADRSFVARWVRFLGWALRQTFVVIPGTADDLTIDKRVSRTPMWLTDDNPLANLPWRDLASADVALPGEIDTLVIGAGFTGAACAYHWSRRAPSDRGRGLVVVEMDDPASGSSGRNEGLVVMGRYFDCVRKTVLGHLPAVRADLSDAQRGQLALQFARKYCSAAYRNADLIEKTIRDEGFDCDYARAGWVQARDQAEQSVLASSVQIAQEEHFVDWTSISPDEVLERSGMRVSYNAGLSKAAASWHPAKWVWCLLTKALASPNVQLFTRTRVGRVEDAGEHYNVYTDRGVIRARHVVCATEAYTPKLHAKFHDAILPMQEQAACGDGGPATMKPHIGISGAWWFGGRYGKRVLFGSGGSRLPDREAGRNRPSRFLSRWVGTEMKRLFGPYQLNMTNEWSGTVGYTPDEYPIVGAFDGKRQYIVAGMCGSGSGVSFNGARCVCNRILDLPDEPDDYPPAYFAPSRLLDPHGHDWPELEA